MLDYAGTVDLSGKPHQQRLAQPPTVGVRDWRTELAPADMAAFEEVAGDLLVRLGYEVRGAAQARRRLGRAAGCSPTGSASAPSRRLHPRNSGRRSGAAATPPSASGSTRHGATLRPRNAARIPLAAKKYVRSVAITGEYFPIGSRHTISPSETRSANVRCSRVPTKTRFADHDRRAEDAAADPRLPQLAAVAGPEGAQAAVEAPDEDPAVGDRRRRVAQATDPPRPHDVPVPRIEGNHLAGARDRIQASPVGGRAGIEALVTERVAGDVRAPQLRARVLVQAEDGARRTS